MLSGFRTSRFGGSSSTGSGCRRLPRITTVRRNANVTNGMFLDRDLELQSALDIREYTNPHHAANVPHTVILGPGLVIEKVYVGYWYWGRPSPYQLWQDLGELLARTKPDFDPTSEEARVAYSAA